MLKHAHSPRPGRPRDWANSSETAPFGARQSKTRHAIQETNLHCAAPLRAADEARIMRRLMALIALGLTALTLGGGALAAGWLLWLGEVRPVLAGLCLVLAGRLVTELAAHPARQLRARAAATRRAAPALLAQGWIFLAMAGWAAISLVLYGWPTGSEPAPLLLWCYAVAVSPWLLFERRHFVRSGSYFLCTTPPSPLLFFELACAAAAAQLLLSSPPQLVAVTFASIMGVSFLF